MCWERAEKIPNLCIMQLAASSDHRVVCWQLDTTMKSHSLTTDHLMQCLGKVEKKISLMSFGNGIQGPQSTLLFQSDFRKILSVALFFSGRLEMWRGRKVGRRRRRRGKSWIFGIVWILKSSLKAPWSEEVFDTNSLNPASPGRALI